MADVSRLAGSRSVDSEAIVQVDGVTIVGDGTSDDPVRLADPGQTQATFLPDLPTSPFVGEVVSSADESGAVAPSSAGVGGRPAAIGVITAIDDSFDPPSVTVRGVGLIILSAQEWDVVTGGTGGLSAGVPYYVSSTQIGHLVTVKPSASGTFVAQVGVALNATTLAPSLPAAPVVN